MAAADLLREAQFAFHNISTGSTDKRKYTARARKFAMRLIRAYPESIEAPQAREILDRLGVLVDLKTEPGAQPPQESVAFRKNHSSDAGHEASASHPASHVKRITKDAEWQNILRRFMELSAAKKKYLGVALFILFVFPGGLFLLGGLAVFYVFNQALLKKHLTQLLTALDSG